jgi:hypothetical protein
VLQHSQERIEVRVPDCCHRFPLVTNDQLCADRPAEFDGRSDLNECRQRDFLSLLPEPLSGLGVLAPEGVEDHDRTVIGKHSELVDHGGLASPGWCVRAGSLSTLLAPDLRPRLSAFRRRSTRIAAGVFLSTLQWAGQRPTFDRSA